MSEIKYVVQGGHGPVPMAENSRRYIDAEPVAVDLQGAFGAYYARRMMSGELVEYAQPEMKLPSKVSEK
jgi:hypothetical protein